MLLSGLFSLAAADVPLSFGPSRGMTVEKKGEGVTELTIDGTGSPHFWTGVAPLSFDPAVHSVVSFEYFSPSGLSSVSIKYRQPDGSMTQADDKILPLAETWQPFSLDLSKGQIPPPVKDPKMRFHLSLRGKTGDSVQIRKMRVRAPNAEELDLIANRETRKAEREADSAAYLQYLRDWYANEITSVIIANDSVKVSGTASEIVSLVELRPDEASHANASLPAMAMDVTGDFSFTFARYAAGSRRDRALSRWKLVKRNGANGSVASWATGFEEGVSPARPPLKWTHQKGLGGIPANVKEDHEIFELGIEHATVNVVLDAAVSPVKRAGLKPFEFEGKTYYFNPGFISQKETTVRSFCKKGVNVTCILLVSNREESDMTHPQAESRGTFAMPDLATEEGAHYYRAAIDFVARRFSRPECRISNWVLHNEIDQAGTWTNMGDQPLARYLETYMRSMRIVFGTTRLYDSTSRTFISLTHHWSKQSSGSGTYRVRDMVELFREMAEAEGDFEWGVAYHPYPRGLRNPDTWDDADVTYDFDTPYITPRNLEVLPAFFAQDRFLFNGEPRGILLSEQGFNSPTLSEEDQRRQAAGLIYIFDKLPDFPVIEAFHLHRYKDMPDREGGLRLGIMDETGNRKLGWEVYAALGTEKESEFRSIANAYFEPSESASQEIATVARPNIVYLVADDLGWSDTTPYLDPAEDFYETPHIAALAEKGMRFTNAYAASPLCSPTRASILTGQYPGRIRLTTPACHLPNVVLDPVVPARGGPDSPAIEPQTRTRFPNFYATIPEQLKTVGYQSAFVGKWHLGRAPYFPDQQGFDLVIGGREHPGPPGGFFAPWPIDTIPQAPEGSHIDDVITMEAVKWIEKQAEAKNPFFLNLWYYSVHAPFEAKPELIEKYAEKAKGLPPGAPRSNPMMGAMIETLDDNVGRITEVLDRLGLSENTLVVFTSDNGGNEYNYTANELATNNHPLRNGKGNILDGGHRVPFIASWPGRIEEGSVNDGLVSSVDLFPTALSAANAPAAPGQVIDGLDLLGIFEGEEKVKEDRAIFCHFPHGPAATGSIPGTSVRKGKWKLTRSFSAADGQEDRLRLIDLETDPAEITNRAEEFPDLVERLDQLIDRHLEDTDSLVPVANPAYKETAGGWLGNKDAILTRGDERLLIDATGTDPHIRTTAFAKATGNLTVEIHMRQEVPGGVALYWGTKSAPGFSSERLTNIPKVATGVWRGDFSIGKKRLHLLRIDPATAKGKIEIDSIRLIEWKAAGEGKTVKFWDF